MATLDANNVKIARTGSFWSAPVTAEFPIDIDTAPSADWQSWGYLSSDGLSEALSESNEDIIAWQNGDVVETVSTEASMTYTIPALETRKHIIEAVYGTTVSEVDGSYVISPGASRTRMKFMLELVDKRTLNKTRKFFEGKVSEIGEITYTSTAAIVLNPTIKVFGDIDVIDENLVVAPVIPA